MHAHVARNGSRGDHGDRAGARVTPDAGRDADLRASAQSFLILLVAGCATATGIASALLAYSVFATIFLVVGTAVGVVTAHLVITG